MAPRYRYMVAGFYDVLQRVRPFTSIFNFFAQTIARRCWCSFDDSGRVDRRKTHPRRRRFHLLAEEKAQAIDGAGLTRTWACICVWVRVI